MGFGFGGLGFWAFGCGVEGLGFGVSKVYRGRRGREDSDVTRGCSVFRGFKVCVCHQTPPWTPKVVPLGLGFRVLGLGFRVQGLRFRVKGFG